MSRKKSIFNHSKTKITAGDFGDNPEIIDDEDIKDVDNETEEEKDRKHIVSEEFKQSEDYRLLFANRDMRKEMTKSYHTKGQRELRRTYEKVTNLILDKYKKENLLDYEGFVRTLRVNGYFIEDEK